MIEDKIKIEDENYLFSEGFGLSGPVQPHKKKRMSMLWSRDKKGHSKQSWSE